MLTHKGIILSELRDYKNTNDNGTRQRANSKCNEKSTGIQIFHDQQTFILKQRTQLYGVLHGLHQFYLKY
jgi:hypothetical protein